MLESLRKSVWEANLALPKEGLVTWTSGNVSGRDPETNLMVIKPSGVLFEDLTPEDLVVVDMNGKVVEGEHGPSSDTATHLWIYRNRDDVHGIVHTHSSYATAFAAVNKPIPVVLTAIADEFGGPIPCGGYASIGGKEIGEEILRTIGDSPAILMKNHGVFTIGTTVQKAIKAAIMTEDVAKTVWLALQIGVPDELSPAEVAANYDRYQNRYGTSEASIIDF
ncbi:MAG: L-ribulose-5-phosphate 4-epimerase [Chloroflexi bacterium]|nr:MAG: L-ribulose-5-phosphate 4-epimerase [Chloroflexota bacterium]